MANEFPKISVIIPVKNEAAILTRCLDSLLALDYPKECLEIILADGHSRDTTREIALKYSGVQVIENPKEIVAAGRNVGFKIATGELVAFTDADCTFDKSWLKNALKYFADKKVAGIGGVTLSPASSTSFEKAISSLFYLSELASNTAHRKQITTAMTAEDIPGCNAIYRREVLEQVMPVDESLLTAEDVWMNFNIKKLGYKLLLVPDVIVTHFRRNSAKKFMRQIYRFAIGRAQVGKRNATLLSKTHILIGGTIPVLLLLLLVAYWLHVATWLMFGALFILAGIFLLALTFTQSVTIAMNMILVMVIFVFSWSAGFLREMLISMQDASGK